MRANNVRPAFFFFLAAVIFAILTFYADPRYRASLRLVFSAGGHPFVAPSQPPPILPYALVALLVSFGFGMIREYLRDNAVKHQAQQLAADIIQFDNECTARGGVDPSTLQGSMEQDWRFRHYLIRFQARLKLINKAFQARSIGPKDHFETQERLFGGAISTDQMTRRHVAMEMEDLSLKLPRPRKWFRAGLLKIMVLYSGIAALLWLVLFGLAHK